MSGVVRAERRFRARRRALRRRVSRPALLAAIATTVVGAAVWGVLWSPLLRLDTVRVVGVSVNSMSRLTAADVLAAARVPRGVSLARIRPASIRDRIAAIPAVAAVDVRRAWPHGLDITVRERVPVAAATSPAGVALVDATGTAFAQLPVLPPPTLHLLDLRLSVGLDPAAPRTSPAARDAQAAVAVWQTLPPTLRRQVRWMTAPSPDAVSFVLSRQRVVVWGSATGAADKLAVLRALLRHRARRYDVSTPTIAVTSG